MELKTGNDLKKWRDVYSYTQKELAELIHISPSHIAHIEADDKPLSKNILKKISQAENNYLGDAEITKANSDLVSKYADTAKLYQEYVSRLPRNLAKIYSHFADDGSKETKQLLKIWCEEIEGFCEFLNLLENPDENLSSKITAIAQKNLNNYRNFVFKAKPGIYKKYMTKPRQ